LRLSSSVHSHLQRYTCFVNLPCVIVVHRLNVDFLPSPIRYCTTLAVSDNPALALVFSQRKCRVVVTVRSLDIHGRPRQKLSCTPPLGSRCPLRPERNQEAARSCLRPSTRASSRSLTRGGADDLANDGIDRTFVDTSSDLAQRRVIQRCRTPEGAKQFILENRCEGTLQLRFILDTIQFALPKSYDVVQELNSNVLHDMDMCPDCQDDSQHHICMCCLLAQS
jgi:hypothetical protein